ncbi:ras-like protein [Anaeramoeba flamelloides]|uniref:Ras-like protein n=1 Tax=Anaeramoeba flamelloides TaxID=1746091 RepID=A0AAV7Z0Y6_9EUKA|nr:ras-like protein [Anaeramoeba flamelloides]KAJ6247682.1 ras-like protein [Anaeramoeba flamelloides]
MGERFRVVLIGGSGVGKSAITIMFLQGTFISEYDPTLEETYRKTITINGKCCLLDILDTAGQERYHTLESHYVRNGDGFIIVYSITSKATFSNVRKLYDLVLRVKDSDSFPTVILGNKNDLEEERDVTIEEGKELSTELGCPFFETSAKENHNIAESFTALVINLRKKLEQEGLLKKKKKKCSIL